MVVADIETVSDQEVEKLRREVGVSRTSLSELLTMYSPETIRTAYTEFSDQVKANIARELKRPDFTIDGKPYLSAIQAASALGVGEFHLSNLRDRNKLSGRQHGRRVVYSRADLVALLKPTRDDKHRGPLAVSFTRWLALREA